MAFLRVVPLLGVFLFACAGTLQLGVRTLDQANVRAPAVGLNLVPVLFEALDEIHQGRGLSGPRRLAFLGDSISISVQGGGRTVPQALRRELGDDVEVHSLAALGVGPFDYYFLADQIAEAQPDQVVIAFSLQSFGEFFRSLSRERLSGWVSPARVFEVALAPTHWIGLHGDDLLMNVAIVNAFGAEIWRQLLIDQARLGVARREFAAWAGDVLGRRGPEMFRMARFDHERRRGRVEDPERDRYNADAERRHYGGVLTGLDDHHPILAVLERTLDVLRDADIPTLVYLNPINVEHLAAVGALADGRLERSLTTIEAVVRAGGGDFLDLHGLLPDSAFRDAAGHLGPPASPEGPVLVAAAVAARLERDQN